MIRPPRGINEDIELSPLRRRFMTVCVAAMAEKGKAIVMVADKAATVGPMQADTRIKKILPIGKSGWYALLAGDPTFGMDVIARAASKTDTEPSCAESFPAMMACIKEVYQQCRETHLVDTLLTPNLLTKELVVARPANLLPLEPRHYLGLVKDISQFKAGCSLLVCGFDKSRRPQPHIFSVTDPGKYENHDLMGYWAIGMGQETALARLLSMDVSKEDELARALYSVFDAKVNAEIMQTVGYNWDADILPLGRTRSVPVPRTLVSLIDRVYETFPRSPFDTDAGRSPKNWSKRVGRFVRTIIPGSPDPEVVIFRRKRIAGER